mgnify:CR=1 FL=1
MALWQHHHHDGQLLEEILHNYFTPDLVKAWTVARHGQLCFQVVSASSGQNWTVELLTN